MELCDLLQTMKLDSQYDFRVSLQYTTSILFLKDLSSFLEKETYRGRHPHRSIISKHYPTSKSSRRSHARRSELPRKPFVNNVHFCGSDFEHDRTFYLVGRNVGKCNLPTKYRIAKINRHLGVRRDVVRLRLSAGHPGAAARTGLSHYRRGISRHHLHPSRDPLLISRQACPMRTSA